ncbi:hypothetical protein K2X92_01295, partial [Candidatus Gracilibacteria bacterium]|nr:hypothetical protein [Candidatus Gracilibacteria bacterium]
LAIKGGTGILTPINTIRITAGYQGFERSVVLDRVTGRSEVLKGRDGTDNPPLPPVNGVCDNTTQYACTIGLPSSLVTNYTEFSCGGTSTWNCIGIAGGSTQSCSKGNPNCPINGVCNNSTQFGCITGIPSNQFTNYTGASCGGVSTWDCMNQFSGSNDIGCSMPNPICAANYCNATNPICDGVGCNIVFLPTSINQPWLKNALSCGFSCINGYEGPNCNVPPPAISCSPNTRTVIQGQSASTVFGPSADSALAGLPGKFNFGCEVGGVINIADGFTITSGSLPPGITLYAPINTSAGIPSQKLYVDGIFTTSGAYTFQITTPLFHAGLGTNINASTWMTINVLAVTTPACTGSMPANSYATTSATFTQTGGVPASIGWNYARNVSVTECKYACNNGYYWNGATCNPALSIGIGGTTWTLFEDGSNPNLAAANEFCMDYGGYGANIYRIPTQSEINVAKSINYSYFNNIAYWTSTPGPTNPATAYAGWRGSPHDNWADCFPGGSFCMGTPNTNTSTVRCIQN